jgi:hypothetical protein
MGVKVIASPITLAALTKSKKNESGLKSYKTVGKYKNNKKI